MQQTKSNPSASLRTVGPWIGAMMALLVAAIILSRFIDTLHVSIQRGQELRAGAYASAPLDRETDIQMADAGIRQKPTVR